MTAACARPLKLYAISGSLRALSTNRAMLEAFRPSAPDGMEIELDDLIGILPIFNPDMEGDLTPAAVLAFAQKVADADGLIVASPEYAHGIPGGLKNALDWLVSRSEIPGKPVMLVHASHRGDFALDALREVLKTISTDLCEEAFLRVPLIGKSPESIDEILAGDAPRKAISDALTVFAAKIRNHAILAHRSPL